jgi:hypothetical protein
VLIYLDRRFTIGHGRLFAIYVAGYCIGRFYIELLRDDAATHIAGIRINSFTSTFVFIGAVVYLILAPKGREDPASLSGSAADRLVPDSVNEDTTDSAESTASIAAVADEPVGGPETTATTAVDLAGVDKPETVAEAVAAEVDAPEVEVAGASEQADTDEPEPDEAAAEPEPAEQDVSAEAEPESADTDEPEPDEAAAEPEPAEGEAAEADKVETEADKSETEADESEADAAEEAAESAGDEAAEAEEPTREPTDSTATQSGWRQRLNSRLRRR